MLVILYAPVLQGNVLRNQPRKKNKQNDLISQFAEHLIQRLKTTASIDRFLIWHKCGDLIVLFSGINKKVWFVYDTLKDLQLQCAKQNMAPKDADAPFNQKNQK